MMKHEVKIIQIIVLNVQMMTQTLTVLMKDELLSIGGIETLMKKIKKRNRPLKSVQNKFRTISFKRQLRQ